MKTAKTGKKNNSGTQFQTDLMSHYNKFSFQRNLINDHFLGIMMVYIELAYCGTLPVLVNKVLLGQNHVHLFICLYIVVCCFCATVAEFIVLT